MRFAAVPPRTTFATGTRVVFDEAAVTVRLLVAVCASPTVKARAAVEVFALIVVAAMVEIVGAVFDAFTVRTKLELALSEPSETVRVIVAVPD